MDKNSDYDTLKKEKDDFQCLFQEIYEILDENKYKIKEENIIEVKKSVQQIQVNTNYKKTNLVLVGDFNSGKTTCCNTLIASLIIAILLYLAVIISVVLKLARWYMLLLPIFGLLGVWLFMRFGSLLN